MKIVRVRKARVVWSEIYDITLKESFKKFYDYAYGDGESGIWWHPAKKITTHNNKIIFIYMRYLIVTILLYISLSNHSTFGLLIAMILLYLIWPIYKWSDVIKNWEARLWLPVVQMLFDIAVMMGFVRGILTFLRAGL